MSSTRFQDSRRSPSALGTTLHLDPNSFRGNVWPIASFRLSEAGIFRYRPETIGMVTSLRFTGASVRALLGVLVFGSSVFGTYSRAAEKSTVDRVIVEGEILDTTTGKGVAARIYIRSDAGKWYFATTSSRDGTAVRYEKQRANTNAIEMHTTLSAHPFRVELPPGRYAFTIERGKEYLPLTRDVTVAPGAPKLSFVLRRWVNMAEAGWYSGDTHTHRAPDELASAMLAEDVNVVLPMLDWTTESHVSPRASSKSVGGNLAARAVAVDATHVWYPRNTEYEIFRTENRDHRLGAFLILNHRTRFDQKLFPLSEIARQARAEGALIDLEKHNWNWSMTLVPILNVDLFELANNHHWQSEFAVRGWAVPAPAWMKLSGQGNGTGTDTERDWTLYGFQSYYALLNCGFKLRPTAGTANGVHPVPLGFSRVYVHLDEPFSYDAWMRGLGAGRSFVTTGPMLRAKVDGQWPGATFALEGNAKDFPLNCTIDSQQPLESIELIENGEVVRRFEPVNRTRNGAFQTEITTDYRPKGTAWVAWRCFERRAGGRIRFAHTAPWYFNAPGESLRPRRDEAQWLVAGAKAEIARSRPVVPASLIADYERALKIYEDLAAKAR